MTAAAPTLASPIRVRTGPSFIRFVYSFSLAPTSVADTDGPTGASVLAHAKRRAPDEGWRDRRILKDYVLPHLADHLNASEHESEREVGHWWTFEGDRPERWEVRPSGSAPLEVRMNAVELLLFRTGVGMVVLDLDLVSESLEDWQRLLHAGRFYRFPDHARGGTFARRAPAIRPLLGDEALGEPVPKHELAAGFGSFIASLLEPVIPDGEWTRASVPGLLTPYSALFVEWQDASERERFEGLYRWRRLLNPTAAVQAVDHQDLHAGLEAYGKDMWLSYSFEGGGFFAANVPDNHFFGHELPDHLRKPYAFGFLLALHQRLALSRFSERIGRLVAECAGGWSSDLPPRNQLAALQDDFLEFLTRCRFVQVLRTENHHANYRHWEDALEVEGFAAEVERELTRLFERAVVADQIIDASRQADVSRRVNAAVLGFALPTLVLAVLAIARPAGMGLGAVAAIAVITTVVGVAGGWLVATYAPLGRPNQHRR